MLFWPAIPAGSWFTNINGGRHPRLVMASTPPSWNPGIQTTWGKGWGLPRAGGAAGSPAAAAAAAAGPGPQSAQGQRRGPALVQGQLWVQLVRHAVLPGREVARGVLPGREAASGALLGPAARLGGRHRAQGGQDQWAPVSSDGGVPLRSDWARLRGASNSTGAPSDRELSGWVGWCCPCPCPYWAAWGGHRG